MDGRETREEMPMNVMIHKPAEREAELMQANREELVERIAWAVREDGTTIGYQDASHFNREYKSLFGIPPMRDMQRLREEAQEIISG